jgi:YgiT-type zinc finger domain-containing protein
MKAKPAENPEIVCSVCGAATARAVERPQVLGKGTNLIVVERVPMYSCRNCGQTYFTVEVARALDEIRLHPEQYAAKRQVPVAEFA